MTLKPQDVLVLLKLVAIEDNPWTYNEIAVELYMSPAEVHAAVRRALAAGLAVRDGKTIVPERRNLEEFLVHGIRHVFYPERGEPTTGMPTLTAAAPLRGTPVGQDELPPVWPDPEGEQRGASFMPLYKSAPRAARADPGLYELLVLVDAIRGGDERVRGNAIRELRKRLNTRPQEASMQADRRISVLGDLGVSQAALIALLHRHHIGRLALFGAATRGELTPASEIELLVEFEPGRGPLPDGMAAVRDDFSVLFGGRGVSLAAASILGDASVIRP